MKRIISFLSLFLCLLIFSKAQVVNDSVASTLVYKYKIFREIGSTSWVHTQEAFEEAKELNADFILLHMNTYGGQVVFADSIRTKILNSDIPVHVFIDNNAASAGALISIACDSIYMRPGANIGAATVVNQSGEKMPDKYQSYMRSTIRATAESHGKDTIITPTDTIIQWKRDPHIAEAMVDESITIPGVIDTGKILTFTTLEAIKHGFCEGQADNVEDVLRHLEIKNYKIIEYKPSFYDGLRGFLTSPILQGILILIIIGGIYFELQTPGVGFPLMAAITAAIIYFAPLYIDGLAANWEIILFIIGLVLIGIEVFVIPGFGFTGISGIILVITGLTLSLLNNDLFDFSGVGFGALLQALVIVLTGIFASFISSIYLSKKLLDHGPLSKLALQTSQETSMGYVGVEASLGELVGKTGEAQTVLRPAGKIEIDGNIYDAKAEAGFIQKGEHVEVIGFLTSQLYVRKKD
ncbi:nodulation protein NfeD [Marinilabiliaceae bacterium JC017]|nr:nodulation protein NfeD [Marinilabiliaceae bacterium JC017]